MADGICFPSLVSAADGFVDAAFDAAAWPKVLHALSLATNSTGSALIPVKVENRIPGLPHSEGVASLVHDYVHNGWNKHDLRAAALPKMLRTGVMTDRDALPIVEIPRNYYYQEFIRKHGLMWFAALSFRAGEELWGASFQRTSRQGEFSIAELEELRSVSSRFTTAATLARSFSAAHVTGMQEAFESLDCAVLLADRTGRILHGNRQAEPHLRTSLPLRNGMLAVADERERQLAQDHIRAAVRNANMFGRSKLEPVKVTRPGKRPLLLRAIAVPAKHYNIFSPAAAMVLIIDPEARAITPPELLSSLFGLTRTEAKLAAMLAEGKNLQDCAAELGSALSSVRQLTKQVLSKTDTHRQTELVTLVAKLRGAVTTTKW